MASIAFWLILGGLVSLLFTMALCWAARDNREDY